MPNYKVVFQYTAPQKGWTEVFYRTATDLPTAASIPQQLILFSLALRDPATTLAKIRVSDVLNNRSSLIIVVNQPGTSGSATLGPAITASAAVINLVSTQIPSSRKVWLRGFTNSAISRRIGGGSEGMFAGTYQTLGAWINQLSTNGFTIRSLTKVGPPPNNFVPILTAGGAPSTGQAIIGFAVGPVLIPGSQISIGQVNQKTFPGLKGIFTVLAATATSATIAYNSPLLAATPITKGRFRLATYQYGAIQNQGSDFMYWSTRSTGRSPLGGRGARRGGRGLRSA